MIATYGLYWKVDEVDWGRPGAGNSGTLLGADRRSKNAQKVDFRRQRGIYALYSGFDLVYVGQTGTGNDRLFKRLKHHRQHHLSERWDRFSWFGIQRVVGSPGNRHLSADLSAAHPKIHNALNVLEAVAIAIAEPRLNLQRGNWGSATQYFQVPLNREFEEEE